MMFGSCLDDPIHANDAPIGRQGPAIEPVLIDLHSHMMKTDPFDNSEITLHFIERLLCGDVIVYRDDIDAPRQGKQTLGRDLGMCDRGYGQEP